MAQTLAELLVKLGIDAGAYYREREKASRQTAQLKADIIDLAQKAAAAFTVYKVADSIKAQIDAMDDLDEMAQKTGASVEALSQLKYGADLEGVEDFTTSLVKLQQAMVAGQNAGSEQAKAFKALGISVRDASGQLKTSDQVLIEVAGALSEIPDGAAKSAVAITLFGKAGAQLIPFLNNGADGLKRYMDEAKRFGLTVTREAAAAAAKFNDDMFRLNAIMQGTTRTIATAMVPALDELVTKLTDPKMVENAQTLAAGMVKAFDWAATGIGHVVDVAKWAGESLAALSVGPNDPVRIDAQIAAIADRVALLKERAADGTIEFERLISLTGEFSSSLRDREKTGLSYSIEHELELLAKENDELLAKKKFLAEFEVNKPKAVEQQEAPKPAGRPFEFGNNEAAANAAKAMADWQKDAEAAMRAQMELEESSRNAVRAFMDDLRTQEEAAFATYAAIKDAIINDARLGVEQRESLLVSAEQRLTARLAEIDQQRIDDAAKRQADADRAKLDRKALIDRQLQNDPLAVFSGIDSAEELERMQAAGGATKQALLDIADLSRSALGSANRQFGDLAANAVLFGEDGSEAAKQMGRALAVDVVSGLFQVGTQMLAQKALSSMLRAADTTEQVAANTAIAASAAPAAAAVSTATFGGSAIAGITAMAAAAAAAMGLFAVVGGRELGGGVSPGAGYGFLEQDKPEVYRRRSDGRMFLFGGASGGDVIPGQQIGGGGLGGGVSITYNDNVGVAVSTRQLSDGQIIAEINHRVDRGMRGAASQAVSMTAAQIASRSGDVPAALRSAYVVKNRDRASKVYG